MNKKGSLFVGLFLVALGILSLAGNVFISLTDRLPVNIFQMWPTIVIGIGLLFVMPPFFFPQTRGLAGLFIPGMPILVTGGILFAASVTNRWELWSIAWPLEVIALALGFLLAAIFMRVIWLLIPAFLIGFTGAVLQFCALTGFWAAWAALWTVEPLALGLAFIIIGLKEGHRTLALVGAGFSGFAGLAFAGISFFSVTWRFANVIAPVIVIGLGVLLLALSFFNPAPKMVTPVTPEEMRDTISQ
jgi:hypothetical protein